ncbi:hypothetical protein C1645_841706 [Glomus cerebriforme]|uniref:Uncharacterized protein n=1 Tax=Glomus cerebriforme TaxID=658196 RepID=A0A397S2T9_9GLOM|nr:hypothetical protein C1645_841706 [Glomus cerebriforme]
MVNLLSSSVWNGKKKRLEEKTVLCAFSSILKSKMFDTGIRNVLLAFRLVREIENNSPSVRALGIRKR